MSDTKCLTCEWVGNENRAGYCHACHARYYGGGLGDVAKPYARDWTWREVAAWSLSFFARRARE